MTLVLGSLMILVGIAFAAMYVLEAVIGTQGESDRSLIFWYLPILFIGIALVGAGVGMGRWGFGRLRMHVED